MSLLQMSEHRCPRARPEGIHTQTPLHDKFRSPLRAQSHGQASGAQITTCQLTHSNPTCVDS